MLFYIIVVSFIQQVALERFVHQNPVFSKRIGECVEIEAKTFFDYPERVTKIEWKKDSQPLKTNERILIDKTRLRITSLRMDDYAYYEVSVSNLNTSITEITNSWIRVQGCAQFQKEEKPSSVDSCAALCTDKCEESWIYVEGSSSKCFQYFDERLTWSDASEKCQSIGGELATIDNMRENSFAGDLIKTASGAWIGLNDRDTENNYIWNFNRGSKPSVTVWGKGEPSNYNRGCNIENCVLMKADSGAWIDYVCEAFRAFVCEIDVPKNVSKKALEDTEGWKCTDSTRCYKYHRIKQNWWNALRTCNQIYSGKLVEIYSQTKNNFVQSISKEDVWIGLNDQWEAGDYRWNIFNGENGKKASYTNWKGGDPNDVFYEPFSGGCPGEDCVQMRASRGQITWHDLGCGTRLPYLCEKKRNRTFSTGAYVAMVIGSLITLAVIVGIIHAAYEKHKRTAVKDIIKSAYQQDMSNREQDLTNEDDEIATVIKRPTYKPI